MFEAHKKAKTFAESFIRLENEDLHKRLAALQPENAELLTQHRTEHCEAAGYDCEELGVLRAALSRVEAERDAAIAEISHACATCGMFENGACPVLAFKDYPKDCEHWRWRGAQGEG